MKKVGILGGTFDPIHNGHIYLAKTAMEKCNLEKVMFLPLNVPPHKEAPTADPLTRYELIQSCIADIPEFFVSDMEIKRQGTTYTVYTLKELKEQHPDWDMYYIIGTDTLYDLEKWREAEKVFELCTFVCMTRPHEDFAHQESYAKKLGCKFKKPVIVIPTMGKDVSSTLIRHASAKELYELVPKEITDRVIEIYAKDEKQ